MKLHMPALFCKEQEDGKTKADGANIHITAYLRFQLLLFQGVSMFCGMRPISSVRHRIASFLPMINTGGPLHSKDEFLCEQIPVFY